MAKMIDADEYFQFLRDEPGITGDSFRRSVDKLKSMDAVEVVLCQNCKHRIFDEVTKEWFCNSWHSGFVYVKPNDFCSYGERKDPDD